MFLRNSNVVISIVLGFATLLCHIDDVMSHGRLWEPPSRSSMWRRGYNTTVNINDNELSCGGFTNQWIAYRGLCGVCGDPYQQNPRDNENGGKYASGIITRTYPIGRNIDVVVGLTANHEGYFEFRLCPTHDPAIVETQACMERHPLRIVNGDDNGSKYFIKDPQQEGDIHLQLELPPNFECRHCVLRWRYRTGTRWGCDPDQTCGSGKGPQEEFYGCSDIAIASVTSVVYNDPVKEPGYGTTGLNDLGSAPTHRNGVFISTNTPVYEAKRYRTEPKQEHGAYSNYAKAITIQQYVTPPPVKFSHFREFLENITLNALISYYGQHWYQTPGRCSPTKRYARNPIMHEYCRRVCSTGTTVCPPSLCTCDSRNVVATPGRFQPNDSKGNGSPLIDTKHLRRFVKRLIFKNKLMYANEPLEDAKEEPMQTTHSEPIVRKTSIDNNKRTKEVAKGLQYETDKTLSKSERILPKSMNCKASNDYSHNPFMTKWCNTNCPFGFCPKRVCTCT